MVGLPSLPWYCPWCAMGQLAQTKWEQSRVPSIPPTPCWPWFSASTLFASAAVKKQTNSRITRIKPSARSVLCHLPNEQLLSQGYQMTNQYPLEPKTFITNHSRVQIYALDAKATQSISKQYVAITACYVSYLIMTMPMFCVGLKR